MGAGVLGWGAVRSRHLPQTLVALPPVEASSLRPALPLPLSCPTGASGQGWGLAAGLQWGSQVIATSVTSCHFPLCPLAVATSSTCRCHLDMSGPAWCCSCTSSILSECHLTLEDSRDDRMWPPTSEAFRPFTLVTLCPARGLVPRPWQEGELDEGRDCAPLGRHRSCILTCF